MSFKRRVLSALGKELLLDIGRGLELDVTTRMGVEELRDALARSKRANLARIVSGDLARDTLKDICTAVGIDDSGREKAAIVERILAAAGKGSGALEDAAGGYAIDAAEARGGHARDAGGGGRHARGGAGTLTARLPGFEDAAATPSAPATIEAKSKGKAKGKAKVEGGERRRAGVPESEAAVAGTLKAALQQFALGAAGGYAGKNGPVSFTTHLLECFGWAGGRPGGAEIPRVFAIADGGQRVEREVALWWPERRTLMEVAPHDAVLDSVWRDLLRVCLQLTPVPQYVVLTNQRDLQLYDLARDRDAPRLALRIDDLPKYSEAFPFFTTTWVPGATPKIVNVEKVSGEVADLVAKLYRSVRAQHPKRERDVIRFTLQCITAMFAEDIGLLPKSYFTSLLYEGARDGTVDRRLRELFVQMNTANLPAPRVVPYFNGGLFTDVAELDLGPQQIVALTKAAEANWTYVDPHIFGSVFQGIMDDAERHASGAHYTAHDDIMRVVGPTIVEPWRRRIAAATSLKDLTEIRKELFAYRVLDPACGSGNFLYVAFRELYRLDTELLSRMREWVSTHDKLSWNGGISAANFYGIDINPFAVELAKVTLNIAKKIAFEERRAQAFALAGQVEMDIDPSLPLDNLDQNIVCADALFTGWPQVEAIVSNPPFLGDRKIRSELGADYLVKLQASSGIDGVVDLCCYWFRKSHDHLRAGTRAGLVATSGIRIGKARESSLDYILANGGTITNAVSSRLWPGEAALNVSMVNWIKGSAEGPHMLVVDDQILPMALISSHLQATADVGSAKELKANEGGTSMGMIFGHAAFVLQATDNSLLPLIRSGSFLRPVAAGTDMLTGALAKAPDRAILLTECGSETEAKAIGGQAFEWLRRTVLPSLTKSASAEGRTQHYERWLRTWWQPLDPRRALLAELKRKQRFIVCASPQARPIFVLLSSKFVPTNTLQVFAFEDDYSFGVIQSGQHWEWTKAKGGRVTERIRYTSEVWQTFPWPQDPTDAQVVAVAAAAKLLRRTRDTLMADNDWSLRQLHQAAEVEGPHPLKDAQAALDAAVADAYGMPPGTAPTEFLLELNQLVAEDEAAGRTVRGPGLPDHLDPKDPRWFSTDCIEPPPLES